MDSSKSSTPYPVVPHGEQKCVWMTAGILSYQLCEREFDCDHCPLDAALRTFPQHADVPAPNHTGSGATSVKKKTLLPGYLYSRKHCWLKPLEGSVVRVGLEPMLASMLLGSKTVVLPSVCDRVQANKASAWIVLESGTLPITSPLDGEVCRTNAALVDQPIDIRNDPYDQGWMFDVTTSEEVFNLSFLFRTGEASRLYAEDEKKFQSLVSAELRKHRAAAGATLADGGQPVQDVESMLGSDKFFHMLMLVFS